MSEKGKKAVRGFEVISSHEGKGIKLPVRKTSRSAGYDLEASEDVLIEVGKIAVVSTGLKAYMAGDEYLGIHIRSGLSFRNSLSLINDEGIIDADYYNNADNEGHIQIGIINLGDKPFMVNKGERIAQAIFKKYLKVDDDDAEGERKGGMGSTGQ
ncbi:MAG: dUTP diphosphatase [Nitrospirota bacterium]|nr:MAG: dUTP diphosphatase [Nitrospirota bacterium]